jgi:hypothetical protein
VLLEEGTGANVTQQDGKPQPLGPDDPGEAIGNFLGVLLPAVLGPVLETPLRPPSGVHLPDLIVLALDLDRLLVPPTADHVDLTTGAIHDHDGVTGMVLHPVEERQEMGQRADPDLIADLLVKMPAVDEFLSTGYRDEPAAVPVRAADDVVE